MAATGVFPMAISTIFNLEKPQQNLKYKSDILRNYMADIVYGANDGIITTFTLVSGIEGAKFPSVIVLVLGFINLFADDISMGASSYLSFRADRCCYEKGLLWLFRVILSWFCHFFSFYFMWSCTIN